MSHLHVPRVCIDGEYQAGGVTANNVLAARDDVNTPTFDPAKNLWHNNNFASNQFSVLATSRVVSAWDADGPVTSDLVLGATVTGDGVMADLDPEHRRVTDLFGFELAVALSPQQEPLVRGTLGTTQLRDFWVTNVADKSVFGVSTVWQSVLRCLTWSADVGRSQVLSRLREVSGGALAVRLTLTHFHGRGGKGKLLAVIGPHTDGDPEQIVPGRRLTSGGGESPYEGFPTASFLVDERRRKLVVDLGSLVPWTLDPKTRLLTGLAPRAGGTAIGSPRDLDVSDWLKSAGLVEWDLTPQDQALLAAKPLQLLFTPNGAPAPSFLNEHPEGKYVDVDRRSLRLNPGETGAIAVYARQLGKPLAGEVVRFNLERQCAEDPIRSLGLQAGDPYYPPQPGAKINGMPADVFDPAPPFSVKTDAKGRAVLSLNVKPGPFTFPPERKGINSQLYFLGDPQGWQHWGALGPEVGAGCALSVLVFNAGTVPATPTWADVSPILERYARLYPFMTQVLNLADKAIVGANAFRIRKRLAAPVDAIEHMPVTRDLSASDRALITKYLDSIIATHQGGQEAR
jgi:hypothetical protein